MRRDARDNREAIVATARDLFSRAGADVSMRAIAKEAGVGVATVSRHFPEREDLVQAVVDAVYADFRAAVEKHVPGMETDPAGTWRAALHGIAELELPALVQGLLAEVGGDEPMEPFLARRAELEATYRQLMEPARRAGLIPADLEPIRLHVALVMISRPLPAPELGQRMVPGQAAWLVDALVDGLEHQARS